MTIGSSSYSGLGCWSGSSQPTLRFGSRRFVSVIVDGEEVQPTAAWDHRNCDQVTADRSGAGSTAALLRICQTVEAARPWPSLASSPWTRR